MYYCIIWRSSDEGEGIDPNAAFVKKSNKKKTEATLVSAKIDNNIPTSQHVTEKQNDTTDVSYRRWLSIYVSLLECTCV